MSPHVFETALALNGANGQYRLELDRTWEGQSGDVWGGVLVAIGTDSANVDLIVDRTSLSAQVVLQELTFLTLKGRIRRIDGQTYGPGRRSGRRDKPCR